MAHIFWTHILLHELQRHKLSKRQGGSAGKRILALSLFEKRYKSFTRTWHSQLHRCIDFQNFKEMLGVRGDFFFSLLVVLLHFYNLLFHCRLTESFSVQEKVNITLKSTFSCLKIAIFYSYYNLSWLVCKKLSAFIEETFAHGPYAAASFPPLTFSFQQGRALRCAMKENCILPRLSCRGSFLFSLTCHP